MVQPVQLPKQTPDILYPELQLQKPLQKTKETSVQVITPEIPTPRPEPTITPTIYPRTFPRITPEPIKETPFVPFWSPSGGKGKEWKRKYPQVKKLYGKPISTSRDLGLNLLSAMQVQKTGQLRVTESTAKMFSESQIRKGGYEMFGAPAQESFNMKKGSQWWNK